MQQIADISFAVNNRQFAFKMALDEMSLPDRDMAYCIQRFGCPEPELVHLLTRVLRPGDFAIDGGANVGFFTVVMAQLVGSSGSVLAIEPSEANLNKLKENLKVNQLQNFEICNQPLWKGNEMVTLHFHEHDGLNSLGNYQPLLAKKIMQATTLNHWHAVPRFIKLDIEGSEEHALRGATKHLVNHVPYIVCELNTEALASLGSTQESLRKFMREWGYSTFIMFYDGQLPCLVPDKTTIFREDEQNGTTNILFSTVDDVAKAWPRAELRYV